MGATSMTKTGTVVERFVGTLAISIFSACYFYALLWVPGIVLLFLWGFKTAAAVLTVPYIISALLPARGCPQLLSTWFFRCALKLHDYEEILEISEEEILEIEKTKKIIYAVQPHGVMSVVGICAAIKRAPRPTPQTCVASVIGRIPILKHVLGIFGLVAASSTSLTRVLRKTSIVLYVGGIAELFLSSTTEERLFVGKRKGFIKLAMRTGSEVIPCYYFGNTTVLEIVRHPFLSFLSRKLGASITVLWGRWGLPIPMPVKTLCVSGKPLGIPQKEFPSDKEVDKFHDLYLKEVKRLFDTYKGRVDNYAKKELIFET